LLTVMHLICEPSSFNASQRFTVVQKIRAIVHVAGRSAMRINGEKSLCGADKSVRKEHQPASPGIEENEHIERENKAAMCRRMCSLKCRRFSYKTERTGASDFSFKNKRDTSLTPRHPHSKTEGHLSNFFEDKMVFDRSALVGWRKCETPGEKLG